MDRAPASVRLRAAWSRLAGVPDLERYQVVVSDASWLCPPGWIGLLSMLGTLTVCVPNEEMRDSLREPMSTLAPDDTLEPDRVLALLGTVREVKGPAVLFYALDITPRESRGEHVGEAGIDELTELIAAVSIADRDEAGLDEIDATASVWRDERGSVVAACGWNVWPGGIAHLHVLVHPDHRRDGLGRAVALSAVRRAQALDFLPQWRARPPASMALARSIGLVEAGAQLSIRTA